MPTEFSQPANTLTSKEAEDVLALWARTHEESEGRVSVREVADALGIGEDEVENLLERVRTDTHSQSSRTQIGAHPSKFRVAAVLWVLAALVVGTVFGRYIGENDVTPFAPKSVAVAPVVVMGRQGSVTFPAFRGPEITPRTHPRILVNPRMAPVLNAPKGYEIQVGNCLVQGSGSTVAPSAETLKKTAQDLVSAIEPAATHTPNEPDVQGALAAFANHRDVEGLLTWEDFKLGVPGH